MPGANESENEQRWQLLVSGLTAELQTSPLGPYLTKKNFGAECISILLKFLEHKNGPQDITDCTQQLLKVSLDAAEAGSRTVADIASEQKVAQLVNKCLSLASFEK